MLAECKDRSDKIANAEYNQRNGRCIEQGYGINTTDDDASCDFEILCNRQKFTVPVGKGRHTLA